MQLQDREGHHHHFESPKMQCMRTSLFGGSAGLVQVVGHTVVLDKQLPVGLFLTGYAMPLEFLEKHLGGVLADAMVSWWYFRWQDSKGSVSIYHFIGGVDMTEIKTIGVVGAGQMGSGIAQVAAVAGYSVILTDISEQSLAKAKSGIQKSLNKLVSKGRLNASVAEAALERIQTGTELSLHGSADLVIEAATENVELKYKIFSALSDATPRETILATNTSSISITAIAAHTNRPDKVMGMHFMNPVPIMKLVELIRGLATDTETYAAVEAAAQRMGKTTVEGRDMPGFIVNRVLMPYINEAVQALYENIASVEDIDQAMKLGTNVPMGPLTLADFIGLDTCLSIMEVLHDGLGAKYAPSPLLRKYVEAGWFGRKSGRGFYDYSQR